MNWLEITVFTNTDGSDLVAEILSEIGSDGVAIYDNNDLAEILKSDVIWDYVDEHLLINNPVVRVIGYFPQSETMIYEKLQISLDNLAKNSDGTVGSLEYTTQIIDEQDWVNVWKKYYKPIPIGDITIVPVWLKYQSREDEKVVLMDPGRAFGTGEHESTRLCLGMLSKISAKDKIVLDIGCGSGILGIAAAKCGAKLVYLSDIDDIAVDAAKYNATLNNVSENVIVENKDLLQHGCVKGDIIFANITADILIKLSGSISNALNCGAVVILSGIIRKRFDEVLNAYKSVGLKVLDMPELGEWRGIMLVKE